VKKSIARVIGAAVVVSLGLAAPAATAQEPQFERPQPTAPGIFTLQGQFARIAYNNEGWVTLGYRIANGSQGKDWLMLEVGLSLRKPTEPEMITRDGLSIKLSDGTSVPLATQQEYNQSGSLQALNARANKVRDSINYFPVEANQACRIGFFSDPASGTGIRTTADQVELSFRRACLGRLFFKLPEGKTIVPGQYWFNVQFAGGEVQAPFRIMTKEEEKYLRKNWKDLKKEHEAFLKQEAEKARQE